MTPLEANVRSAVHEYGGGSFFPIPLGPDNTNNVILYTDYAACHSLFACLVASGDKECIRIETPEAARFADFEYDSKRCRILCIMEDHTDSSPEKVVNSVVSVSLSPILYHFGISKDDSQNQEERIITVAQGNDVYTTPKLSPNGTHVAYTTWNHPNMPWYCTNICVQQLNEKGEPIGHYLTVPSVNKTNDVIADVSGWSMIEPRWYNCTKLFLLSDETGWYNLHVWDVITPNLEPELLWEKEVEFADPHQGYVCTGCAYFVSHICQLVDDTNLCSCIQFVSLIATLNTPIDGF